MCMLLIYVHIMIPFEIYYSDYFIIFARDQTCHWSATILNLATSMLLSDQHFKLRCQYDFQTFVRAPRNLRIGFVWGLVLLIVPIFQFLTLQLS